MNFGDVVFTKHVSLICFVILKFAKAASSNQLKYMTAFTLTQLRQCCVRQARDEILRSLSRVCQLTRSTNFQPLNKKTTYTYKNMHCVLHAPMEIITMRI